MVWIDNENSLGSKWHNAPKPILLIIPHLYKYKKLDGQIRSTFGSRIIARVYVVFHSWWRDSIERRIFVGLLIILCKLRCLLVLTLKQPISLDDYLDTPTIRHAIWSQNGPMLILCRASLCLPDGLPSRKTIKSRSKPKIGRGKFNHHYLIIVLLASTQDFPPDRSPQQAFDVGSRLYLKPKGNLSKRLFLVPKNYSWKAIEFS